MADVARLYREGRGRISDLVLNAGDTQLDSLVPACPEWSVKAIVSHLSGVCADIINGRLDGVATDPWTAAQVDVRKDWPIAKVIEEWDEYAPQCEAICANFGGAEVQWLSDLATHEHDVRGALGKPGERDSEAVQMAFRWLGQSLKGFSDVDGRPLRLLAAEGDEVLVGGGEPVATVKAPRFELFRALTGRRSLEQIDEFEWDGERGSYFEGRWGPFRAASSRIEE